MIRAALSLLALALAATPAVAGVDIQHWTRDNGARVYLVQTEELPIVDIRVMFPAAGAMDGDLPGLARLTNGLLNEGAAGKDAGAIARGFEDLGARYSNGSERDMAWLELRSLSEAQVLDKAVANLAKVLTQPDFPPEALERTRQRMLVALQRDQQEPATITRNLFYSAVYGDHPYAQPPEGTVASLNAIDRDDVLRFYEDYYRAGDAMVVLVGDLDRARADAIAGALTDALPSEPASHTLPPAPAPTQAQVRQAFPASQSHIRIGQPAITRDHPDYIPLFVGNHVLGGGGLVSIVAQEMREKRGLSYSSHASISGMRAEGPFVLSTQVRADRAGEALEVLRSLLADFVENGPTEAQLEAAKRNITGSFPLNLDSNRDILGYVSVMAYYDLPLDYLDTILDKIRAITVDDVRNAFQRHIKPDSMVTVIVGPETESAGE